MLMRLVTIVTTKQDGPVDPRPQFQGGLSQTFKEVKENRARILKPYGIVDNFVRMHPQHGDKVGLVNRESLKRWRGKLVAGRPLVDALVTNLPNVGLECQPADCATYAIFHARLGWLALVHAGREGAVKKILSKTVTKMARLAKVTNAEFIGGLEVWMSPAICGKHYRKKYLVVPREDMEDWQMFISGARQVVDEDGSCKIEAKSDLIGIDFVGFNKFQLMKMGLKPGQLNFSEACTYESDDYASAQQDKLTGSPQGRFMVMAMMEP